MFKQAIVRRPCKQMVNGLTTASLGTPDYDLACEQHGIYTEALRSCGLKVTILDANNNFPDSVFIEDTALLTPVCAILMNPGVQSRRGEVEDIKPVLENLFDPIESVRAPGTAEGGDIMVVGSHYYIGLSSRTNINGADQIIKILNRHGLSASMIRMEKMLHLKTGLAYLEHNNLLATGEFLEKKDFKSFNILEVDERESYAANSIWINNRVIMPSGYPDIKNSIGRSGYGVIEVDTSEFRKLDGGVSCLSLRF